MIALIQNFEADVQNPEFNNNPENFHPCKECFYTHWHDRKICPENRRLHHEACRVMTNGYPK